MLPTERKWKSNWLCKIGFHRWWREYTWSRERCRRCGKWAPKDAIERNW